MSFKSGWLEEKTTLVTLAKQQDRLWVEIPPTLVKPYDKKYRARENYYEDVDVSVAAVIGEKKHKILKTRWRIQPGKNIPFRVS